LKAQRDHLESKVCVGVRAFVRVLEREREREREREKRDRVRENILAYVR
jgi:hypothetical protein